MTRRSSIPSYRKRTIRGIEKAVVTLTDAETRERRDFYLGEYGTEASRQRYLALLREWEARGRRLDQDRGPARAVVGPTVSQICWRYVHAVGARYSKGEALSVKLLVRLLRTSVGETPAASFGPNALRQVREAMIRGDDGTKPARPPWSRGYVNQQVQRVRAIFKWAASHELLPVTVYQALCTVEGLRRGRSDARETKPVGCAPDEAIKATRPHLSAQVAAMVDLQLLTGMRPGEVVAMRPCDLDMSGKVWLYRPGHHKTEHRGKTRTVYLGPKAQAIIRPYLKGRVVSTALFSPAEAEAERRARLHGARKTPAGQGNEPGTNRVDSPKVAPGDAYTVASYHRAIARACELADRSAKAKATKAGVKITPESRLVPRWHPHQLRHNYATNVRKEHGLEAAQILLGHSSALITDAVYAERDMNKAMKIAREIG